MDPRDKLIQAGLALSSELSFSAVLQRIIELAVEITGARYGALEHFRSVRSVESVAASAATAW